MVLFFVIFISLVVINAALLIFSNTLRRSVTTKDLKGGASKVKEEVYPMNPLDSDFQKAV